MTDNDEIRIPEIDDEDDDIIDEKRAREEYVEWLKTGKHDPVSIWDMNPDNAYHCSDCPHNNEGSWNSSRPCGCMVCWVTQTCHTWDGRDDI
jgi:hypothetical protein